MATDDRELTYAQRLWPTQGAAPAPTSDGNASVARRSGPGGDGMTTTGTRTLTIQMPLPSPLLTPNLRLHWRARARHTKQQREDAAWYVAVCGLPAFPAIGHLPQFAGPVRLDVTVRPRPRMKRLDDDNLWAALKATRDGIADALGLDDRVFVIGTLTWASARTSELVIVLSSAEG